MLALRSACVMVADVVALKRWRKRIFAGRVWHYINFGVYGSLQVPNCVGSRGDALASEEATMQHNVTGV